MSATTLAAKRDTFQSVRSGAIAGLGGGVVFGMLMGMMGMLPMVGKLVGQENAIVGLIVHMLISAFIGGTYGVAAGRLPSGWLTAVIAGMVNGVVWWVLGALLLMPLGLGMTQMVFVIGQAQWMSLMGHAIYGIVTGLLFVPLNKRQ
jgi:uncharacterized membrane protein YagU involved in acid resistance